MTHQDVTLPGRLGDPSATLLTDPRLDPRIAAAFAAIGDLAPGLAPPALGADYDACLAYCAAFEAANALTHEAQRAALPDFADVVTSTETIPGDDGNDIQLFIHRPANQDGPVPGIVHCHGGGMVLMSATDPGFEHWRGSLARTGLVVIGVEFRNGGGRLGTHPFPAGLNDCAAAVRWAHEHRIALGLSAILTSGESGGGNLSIATALKAKREGWGEVIDGVYAMCPYISGAYAAPPPALASLVENDGYMLDRPMMNALVRVYDPDGTHAGDPLAWPLEASVDELRGLPPHVISVNELDPLRDEGLLFYRKLLAAGVPAVGRTVHGTPHAGDGTFPDVTPDIHAETIASIRAFAGRVAR